MEDVIVPWLFDRETIVLKFASHSLFTDLPAISASLFGNFLLL
jgi:hypothetical protein